MMLVLVFMSIGASAIRPANLSTDESRIQLYVYDTKNNAVSGIIVEVYSVSNDRLVVEGKTNSNGIFNATLDNNNEYIFAVYDTDKVKGGLETLFVEDDASKLIYLELQTHELSLDEKLTLKRLSSGFASALGTSNTWIYGIMGFGLIGVFALFMFRRK